MTLKAIIRVKRRAWTAALLVAGLSAAACSPSGGFLLRSSLRAGADRQQVRVLLENTNGSVQISCGSPVRITEIKLNRIVFSGPIKKLVFFPEKIVEPITISSAGDHPLVLGGRCYRGIFELHSALGRIMVINVVTMDEYLCGVVPGEISSSWSIEAIKAQAVAARSYAYHHIMRNRDGAYDLDATSTFQVYGGMSVETPQAAEAVRRTSGEIVAFRNSPIVAYFHSTCGGITADDSAVWKGADMEYLRGVKCGYCGESPYYTWEETLTLIEMREALTGRFRSTGPISGVSFVRSGGRVREVVINHAGGVLRLSGNDFRLLFPAKKIKSMYFTARKTKSGLVLSGHGWGHGVGLCQWGARGMAASGAGYREILKHYYRNVRIINISGAGKIRALETARLSH